MCLSPISAPRPSPCVVWLTYNPSLDLISFAHLRCSHSWLEDHEVATLYYTVPSCRALSSDIWYCCMCVHPLEVTSHPPANDDVDYNAILWVQVSTLLFDATIWWRLLALIMLARLTSSPLGHGVNNSCQIWGCSHLIIIAFMHQNVTSKNSLIAYCYLNLIMMVNDLNSTYKI